MGRCWSQTESAKQAIRLARLARPKKGQHVACAVCGKDFYAFPSWAKYGKGKICSMACKRIYLSGQGNPFHGRSHSEQTRERVSRSRAGKCSGRANHNWCGGYTLGKRAFFTPRQRRLWTGPECVRCGSTERLELDHIVPVFAGGKTERANIQTLCGTCNKRKHHDEDKARYRSV